MEYQEQIKITNIVTDNQGNSIKLYVFDTKKFGKFKFLLARETKELDFENCLSYLADLDLYLEFLKKQEFNVFMKESKVIVEITRVKKYMKRAFKKEIALSKAKTKI